MTSSQHVYKVRPRKDHRGVDLISDALPFGRLWYAEPNAINNAKFRSRSHDAVVHVYEVRPRKDKRGVDLISDALPFGRLWYGGPNAVGNVIGYATRDPASSLSQSVLSRTNPASYRAQSAL